MAAQPADEVAHPVGGAWGLLGSVSGCWGDEPGKTEWFGFLGNRDLSFGPKAVPGLVGAHSTLHEWAMPALLPVVGGVVTSVCPDAPGQAAPGKAGAECLWAPELRCGCDGGSEPPGSCARCSHRPVALPKAFARARAQVPAFLFPSEVARCWDSFYMNRGGEGRARGAVSVNGLHPFLSSQ